MSEFNDKTNEVKPIDKQIDEEKEIQYDENQQQEFTEEPVIVTEEAQPEVVEEPVIVTEEAQPEVVEEPVPELMTKLGDILLEKQSEIEKKTEEVELLNNIQSEMTKLSENTECQDLKDKLAQIQGTLSTVSGGKSRRHVSFLNLFPKKVTRRRRVTRKTKRRNGKSKKRKSGGRR